jgi:hypothetical protein
MAPPGYLDECVDRELAPALRGRGFTVRTASDAGMLGKSDEEQLLHAGREGLALPTHNGRHFRRLHRRFLAEGRSHGGVLVLPQTSELPQLAVRSATMLDWLGLLGAVQSRFLSWGDVQLQLTQGMKLAGYTDAEHRLALGRSG